MDGRPRIGIDENALRQRMGALGSARGWQPHILPDLERFVRAADDYDLFRVDPVRYAGIARVSEAEAIDLFVHAAKIGLFDMDWLLICAYCPQVAGGFRELDQIHPRFRCDFCDAVNEAALDDYIQVAFTVSPAVRHIAFHHPGLLPIEDFYLRYNFAKGFVAPHGMTHAQLVAALSRGFCDVGSGEGRDFDFDIRPGRFEVLDLAHKLLLVFFVDGEATERQGTTVLLESGRFAPDRPTAPRELELGDGRFAFRQTADLTPGPHSLRIENRTAERGRFWFLQYPAGFVPHRVEYEPFLSAKRLLLAPSFRDLYKAQLVDEAEGLAVSDMTFLFTDLKRSTPMYESVGDMNAYFLVRQHFEILNHAIRANGGVIVKTIGDAVMAAFERPQDAVRAAIGMIEDLARFNRTAVRPLGLKVGVHRGRSVAVTLNDRIDYFGQDVNIAARVQGLADVGEICISAGAAEAPGVAEMIGARRTTRGYENLRGVGQMIEVHRVAAAPSA